MSNRDRTDPLRSAQQQIFRGIDESRGSLLNSDGGRRGSDVGNTKPFTRTEKGRELDPAERPAPEKR